MNEFPKFLFDCSKLDKALINIRTKSSFENVEPLAIKKKLNRKFTNTTTLRKMTVKMIPFFRLHALLSFHYN